MCLGRSTKSKSLQEIHKVQILKKASKNKQIFLGRKCSSARTIFQTEHTNGIMDSSFKTFTHSEINCDKNVQFLPRKLKIWS